MQILHVVETLDVGGLERVVIDLVKEQAARGHNCQVICLFEKGELASELEALGIPVAACSKRSGFDLAASRQLTEYIRTFSADVVHTHNVTCNYYAAVALLGRRKTRLVNTRHGIGKLPKKQQWLYGLSLLRTYRVAGVCNVTTKILQRQFSLFSRKMMTIHNGIVLNNYQERYSGSHQALVEKLSLPEDALLVAIVARLNRVKNHSMLLHAFRLVHQAVPQSQLLVIGDGELRSILQSEAQQLGISHYTIFLGDRRDVPFLLSGMDVFALSSTEEGYSISLLEACASALPIVATDVGGNSEIVKNKTNGFLVANNDAEAFAQRLIAILTDASKRREYGKNAREWVEKESSVQVMQRRYEKIYSNEPAIELRG